MTAKSALLRFVNLRVPSRALIQASARATTYFAWRSYFAAHSAAIDEALKAVPEEGAPPLHP